MCNRLVCSCRGRLICYCDQDTFEDEPFKFKLAIMVPAAASLLVSGTLCGLYWQLLERAVEYDDFKIEGGGRGPVSAYD